MSESDNYCNICKLSFNNKQHYNIHCGGILHSQRLKTIVSNLSLEVNKEVNLKPYGSRDGPGIGDHRNSSQRPSRGTESNRSRPTDARDSWSSGETRQTSSYQKGYSSLNERLNDSEWLRRQLESAAPPIGASKEKDISHLSTSVLNEDGYRTGRYQDGNPTINVRNNERIDINSTNYAGANRNLYTVNRGSETEDRMNREDYRSVERLESDNRRKPGQESEPGTKRNRSAMENKLVEEAKMDEEFWKNYKILQESLKEALNCPEYENLAVASASPKNTQLWNEQSDLNRSKRLEVNACNRHGITNDKAFDSGYYSEAFEALKRSLADSGRANAGRSSDNLGSQTLFGREDNDERICGYRSMNPLAALNDGYKRDSLEKRNMLEERDYDYREKERSVYDDNAFETNIGRSSPSISRNKQADPIGLQSKDFDRQGTTRKSFENAAIRPGVFELLDSRRRSPPSPVGRGSGQSLPKERPPPVEQIEYSPSVAYGSRLKLVGQNKGIPRDGLASSREDEPTRQPSVHQKASARGDFQMPPEQFATRDKVSTISRVEPVLEKFSMDNVNVETGNGRRYTVSKSVEQESKRVGSHTNVTAVIKRTLVEYLEYSKKHENDVNKFLTNHRQTEGTIQSLEPTLDKDHRQQSQVRNDIEKDHRQQSHVINERLNTVDSGTKGSKHPYDDKSSSTRVGQPVRTSRLPFVDNLQESFDQNETRIQSGSQSSHKHLPRPTFSTDQRDYDGRNQGRDRSRSPLTSTHLQMSFKDDKDLRLDDVATKLMTRTRSPLLSRHQIPLLDKDSRFDSGSHQSAARSRSPLQRERNVHDEDIRFDDKPNLSRTRSPLLSAYHERDGVSRVDDGPIRFRTKSRSPLSFKPRQMPVEFNDSRFDGDLTRLTTRSRSPLLSVLKASMKVINTSFDGDQHKTSTDHDDDFVTMNLSSGVYDDIPSHDIQRNSDRDTNKIQMPPRSGLLGDCPQQLSYDIPAAASLQSDRRADFVAEKQPVPAKKVLLPTPDTGKKTLLPLPPSTRKVLLPCPNQFNPTTHWSTTHEDRRDDMDCGMPQDERHKAEEFDMYEYQFGSASREDKAVPSLLTLNPSSFNLRPKPKLVKKHRGGRGRSKRLIQHNRQSAVPVFQTGLSQIRTSTSSADRSNSSGITKAVPKIQKSEKAVEATNEKAVKATNEKAIQSTNEKAIEAKNEKAVKATNEKAIEAKNEKTVKATNEKAIQSTNEKAVKTANGKQVTEKPRVVENKSPTEDCKEDPLLQLSSQLPPEIMSKIMSGKLPAGELEKIAHMIPSDVLVSAVQYLQKNAHKGPGVPEAIGEQKIVIPDAKNRGNIVAKPLLTEPPKLFAGGKDKKDTNLGRNEGHRDSADKRKKEQGATPKMINIMKKELDNTAVKSLEHIRAENILERLQDTMLDMLSQNDKASSSRGDTDARKRSTADATRSSDRGEVGADKNSVISETLRILRSMKAENLSGIDLTLVEETMKHHQSPEKLQLILTYLVSTLRKR